MASRTRGLLRFAKDIAILAARASAPHTTRERGRSRAPVPPRWQPGADARCARLRRLEATPAARAPSLLHLRMFFRTLKSLRRIATRYEKTSRNYLAIVHLACALHWLKASG